MLGEVVMGRGVRAAALLLFCTVSSAVAFAQPAKPSRQEAFAAVAALPDWDGTWSSVRGKDPEPVLTPKGAKMKADFEAGQARGENLQVPAANCVPDGMPRIMRLYPIEFLFTPGRVTIPIETYSQIRRVYTDGRPLPEDPDPAFNGSSIGHWEGDTLVVETVGLNNQNNIVRGVHMTDRTRIQERIRLEKPDLLVDTVTVTDPEMLAQPWTYRQAYERHRDWDMREYICTENNHDAADEAGRPSLSLEPN
jgi:hypothetical protein